LDAPISFCDHELRLFSLCLSIFSIQVRSLRPSLLSIGSSSSPGGSNNVNSTTNSGGSCGVGWCAVPHGQEALVAKLVETFAASGEEVPQLVLVNSSSGQASG
jgi:hypothetical protein